MATKINGIPFSALSKICGMNICDGINLINGMIKWLSDPWNVLNAVHVQTFSVSEEESYPSALHFKPDGTKMYVLGGNGMDVNEYDLSTPWDISTAVLLQSQDVSGEDTIPTGIFFYPDGTKMWISGNAGKEINEYNLGVAWNISTAVYSGVCFDDISGNYTPVDIFFKPDGSKMYWLCLSFGDVKQYNLGVAWDISTAVYSGLRDFTIDEAGTQAIFFKPDGTKFYLVGNSGKNVNEYNLETPWDITTVVHLRLFDISKEEISVKGLFFKPDGTKFYLVGAENDEVNEYNL